jgi:hypothetical protein
MQGHGIAMSNTEPYSPWQNQAEGAIREIKRHTLCLMTKTHTPKALWDFCAVYACELHNRIALPMYQLHGRTPIETLTGNTPDISEYLEYEWYQPVWILSPGAFPEETHTLGRWLGVAHRVDQAMCFWVLHPSGIPIARTTIQGLTKDDLECEATQRSIVTF